MGRLVRLQMMNDEELVRFLEEKNEVCSGSTWPILPIEKTEMADGRIQVKSNANSSAQNIYLEIDPLAGKIVHYYWTPDVFPHQ